MEPVKFGWKIDVLVVTNLELVDGGEDINYFRCVSHCDACIQFLRFVLRKRETGNILEYFR